MDVTLPNCTMWDSIPPLWQQLWHQCTGADLVQIVTKSQTHRHPACTTCGALAINQSRFGPALGSPHPHFGAKLSVFLAVPHKITTINACRLYGYQQTVNISSSERYMKTVRAIKARLFAEPNHIVPRQSIFWSKIEHFCGWCDQKYNFVWF